ncbi:MAG TPA: hypothetical protein VL979_12010 [Solirubrobacteraceae bacterium]|nr:hypothetical protein [Solirubrobacteraceae bacterium]
MSIAAQKAQQARLADCWDREERARSRRELGLERSGPLCASHGRPDCPVCRDFTLRRPIAA